MDWLGYLYPWLHGAAIFSPVQGEIHLVAMRIHFLTLCVRFHSVVFTSSDSEIRYFYAQNMWHKKYTDHCDR